MTHSNLKKEFPILSSYTYLNTPFTGIISSSVTQKINQLEEEYRLHGSVFMDYYEDEIIEETKTLIAEIFKANSECVGVLNNFSTGLNCILNDLPESSKVVLLTQDYPSVNLPVKSRNFEVFEVDISPDLYQNLEQQFTEVHPDFFVFSMTQFMSGFQMNLEMLNQLKSAFPQVSFIADATQYCGTQAFDFENSPLDVFGTSGYKWLNAGLGNAFFLFKPDFLEKYHFKTIGSNSLTTKPDGKPRSVGFLEPGHFDILAMARLKFALEFHYKTIGIEGIQSKIVAISQQAKDAFLKLNLLDTNFIQEQSSQHIFSLKGEQKDVEHLKSKGILTSFRGGRIRVGFQYFNTQADLEVLLKFFRD